MTVPSQILPLGQYKTGISHPDGRYLGMLGVDQADGTVVWTCGTAQTANDSVVDAAVQEAMY